MSTVQTTHRPWPGVNGVATKSTFRPIQTSALGFDPVTVLSPTDDPETPQGGYCSWRDGLHRTVEEVEAMALCLLEAAKLMREREARRSLDYPSSI